jgi:hypothetical protein
MTDKQKIGYALAVAFARGHISGDQVARILKLMEGGNELTQDARN